MKNKLDYSFVCLGTVTEKFQTIARLKKEMLRIKQGLVEQTRLDCYPYIMGSYIFKKFEKIGLTVPKESEIFYPSDKYPSHTDSGGTSYMIPLEQGLFTINGVSHPVIPFVLYGFDDGKLHNTDFCAIMLK